MIDPVKETEQTIALPTPTAKCRDSLRGLGGPIEHNVDNLAEDFSNFCKELADPNFFKDQNFVDMCFWIFACGATVPMNPGSAFNTKFNHTAPIAANPTESSVIIDPKNVDIRGFQQG